MGKPNGGLYYPSNPSLASSPVDPQTPPLTPSSESSHPPPTWLGSISSALSRSPTADAALAAASNYWMNTTTTPSTSTTSSFPLDEKSASARERSRSPSRADAPGGLPAPATAAGGGAKAGFWDSQAYWLGLYFFFNLGLTLYNKGVLVKFPFPYTLTGLHALSGSCGCYIALVRGHFIPARLTSKENLVLVAFSVLYTINIAVSNISLQLVTVPVHQVVRSLTPLFTIFISVFFLRSRFSAKKLMSLVPVMAGVGLATYGDYYFTLWGLTLTLIGTFLAALKTIVTNQIQTGHGNRLKLHPLDLLMRMCPLAFVQCVAYAYWTGELDRVRTFGATQMTRGRALSLAVNGCIAFGLNVVSFTANKKTSALTMTVAANVKQVLTIVLAVVIFDLLITPLNALGIAVTLFGGAWYARTEYKEKQSAAKRRRLDSRPQ